MRQFLQWFVFVIGVGLTTSVAAESGRPIGFELYSWQTSAGWRYAVLEGSSTFRNKEVIQSKANRLKDLTFLKGRLAALPAKETVYWHVEPKRGFTLPSKETIHHIQSFAEGMQLKVLLPGDPNIEDPIDKILE